MKFLKWLKGFVEIGTPQSSKRLAGLSCIGVGLVMGVIGGFHFYEVDSVILGTIMGTGTLCLGASAISKDSLFKSTDRKSAEE